MYACGSHTKLSGSSTYRNCETSIKKFNKFRKPLYLSELNIQFLYFIVKVRAFSSQSTYSKFKSLIQFFHKHSFCKKRSDQEHT